MGRSADQRVFRQSENVHMVRMRTDFTEFQVGTPVYKARPCDTVVTLALGRPSKADSQFQEQAERETMSQRINLFTKQGLHPS